MKNLAAVSMLILIGCSDHSNRVTFDPTLVNSKGIESLLELNITTEKLDDDSKKDAARTINVIARRYGWVFVYPDGNMTSELHLAKDVEVRLRATSQDVLHSFFIPEFRLKVDCVPGRFTECRVKPTKSRTLEECLNVNKDGKLSKGKLKPYHLRCAEFCGKGHDQMRTHWQDNGDGTGKWNYPVYVHDCSFNELAKFTGWNVSEHSKWENGKHLHSQIGCAACHALGDQPTKVGPNFMAKNWNMHRTLKGNSKAVFDADYIRESVNFSNKKIVKGFPNVMPKYSLTMERLSHLIEFIKSPTEDKEKIKIKDLESTRK